MGMVGMPSGYASSKITACSAKRFKFGVSTHWLPYAARLSARKVSETRRIRLRLFPVCGAGRSQLEPPTSLGGGAADALVAAGIPLNPVSAAPFRISLREVLLML